MNIKDIIITLLITLTTFVIIATTFENIGNSQNIHMKNLNGFIVTKDSTSMNSVIVAKEISGEELGMSLNQDEIAMINVFDSADFIVISRGDYEFINRYGTYLVEFKGENVANISETNKDVEYVLNEKTIGGGYIE